MDDHTQPQQVPQQSQLSLPGRAPMLALAAMLVLVGAIGIFTMHQYQQYMALIENPRVATAVLGEKSSASCLPTSAVEKSLREKNRTVTLFAPDKSYTLPLSSIAACVQFVGCGGEGVACKDVTTNVDTACVSSYLEKNPEIATSRKVVSGEGASAQVRIQDWTVDTEALVNQLKEAISKEVSYCDVTGEKDARTNIGNIQLVVMNTTPGVEEDFAQQFVEIDKSKAELYLWDKGNYKTFALKRGTRLPREAIYRLGNVNLSSLMQSQRDVEAIKEQTQDSTYVVVHD